MKKVESSHVDAIDYDPKQKRLIVHYKTGKSYNYEGVSQAEYDALEAADSIGSHLHKHIKPHKHTFPHS